MGVSAFFMDHHLYTSDMSILYKALTRWTMESVKTTTVPTVSCSCCVLLWAIRRCAYDIGRSPARRPILRPTSPSPLAERASAPIYRSSPPLNCRESVSTYISILTALKLQRERQHLYIDPHRP